MARSADAVGEAARSWLTQLTSDTVMVSPIGHTDERAAALEQLLLPGAGCAWSGRRRVNGRRLALTELARLVSAAYPDPDEHDTREERRRLLHLDLDDLPLEDLDRERILARLRWALDPEPSPWLEARLRHLDRAASQLRRSMR